MEAPFNFELLAYVISRKAAKLVLVLSSLLWESLLHPHNQALLFIILELQLGHEPLEEVAAPSVWKPRLISNF